MSFPMVGMQANLQFSPLNLGFQGQASFNFQGIFQRHHHHHHCEQDGGCQGGGENEQLAQVGQNMLQTGEDMVQEGQRLIQQGDFQQGMQLVREGARLEQQGARLEQQGEQGNQVNGNGGCGDDCCGDNGLGNNGYDNGFGNNGYNNGFGNGFGNNGYDNGFGNGFGNNGFGNNCGGGSRLSVNGNTVDTGNYTIAASTDASGTLTVTDKCTGKSFKVWGDPHISTDNGQTADFQHAPATFRLPDGTEITVNPTNNAGVNTIDNVVITKGNNAVKMTGFNGNLQTQALPGEGRFLDATTPDGTVVNVSNGDQLTLPDGSPIHGDIDSYASQGNNGGQSDQVGQLRQEIAALEREIEQMEQGMNVTSLMTGGFMSNPLGNYFG
jgi:hypothetical protein